MYLYISKTEQRKSIVSQKGGMNNNFRGKCTDRDIRAIRPYDAMAQRVVRGESSKDRSANRFPN